MFRKKNRSMEETTEDIEAKLRHGLHQWPSMSNAELDAFDSEIQRILSVDLHEDSQSLHDAEAKLSANQMKIIQLFKGEGQDQEGGRLGKLRCWLRSMKLKFTRNWPQSNGVMYVSTLFGFNVVWNKAVCEEEYFRILNVMAMEAMPGSDFISSHLTMVRVASALRWWCPIVPDVVDEAFGFLSWNIEASPHERFSAKQRGAVLNVEKGVLISVCSTGVDFQVTTFDHGSFSLAKETAQGVLEKFKSAIAKLGKIHEKTLQGFRIRVKLCKEAQQCISLKDIPEVTMQSALPHKANYSEVVEFSRVLAAADESQIEKEKRLLLKKLSKFMTKEEQQQENQSM